MNGGEEMSTKNILANFDMPPDIGVHYKTTTFVEDAANQKHRQHGGKRNDPLGGFKEFRGRVRSLLRGKIKAEPIRLSGDSPQISSCACFGHMPRSQ